MTAQTEHKYAKPKTIATYHPVDNPFTGSIPKLLQKHFPEHTIDGGRCISLRVKITPEKGGGKRISAWLHDHHSDVFGIHKKLGDPNADYDIEFSGADGGHWAPNMHTTISAIHWFRKNLGKKTRWIKV